MASTTAIAAGRLSLVAALALAWAGALTTVASATPPSIVVDRTPAALRPGDQAELVAHVERASSCRLLLTRARTTVASAPAALAGNSTVAFRWHVPANARRATWSVTVRCRRAPLPGALSHLPVERTATRTVRVAGRRHGLSEIADRGGIQAIVATRSGSVLAGKDLLTLAISFFGLMGAMVGLILVRRQLKLTREQSMADRTAVLMERFQHLDFTMLWSRVGPNFLRVDRPADILDRMRLFEHVPYAASLLTLDAAVSPRPGHPPGKWGELRYGVNFHEEVGVLFNKMSIDQEQLVRHFGTELVHNFQMAWWWVHWQRENRPLAARYISAGPPEGFVETYAEWERMALAIIDKRKDLLPEPEEGRAGEVRVVCLPRDLEGVEWPRWEAVANGLSCSIGDLDTLEQKLQIDAEAGVPLVITRHVLCVMHWTEHRVNADRLQRLTSALAGKSLEQLEALV